MRNLIIIFIFLATSVFGQTDHSKLDVNCSSCHTCEMPTKSSPCITSCPRRDIIAGHQFAGEGPVDIILDEFKGSDDIYSAVVFSHQVHANMAKMSGGCIMCHHHDPPGEFSSCKKCHESERLRTDIHKPDLKASYHRLCMNCHSQWDNNDSCTNCHTVNASAAVPAGNEKASKGKRMVRNTPKPIDKVYQTRCPLGRTVTFSHHDHHDVHGIGCAECHKNESCTSCHSQDKVPSPISVLKKKRHQDCSGCHDTLKNCTQCHKEIGNKAFIRITDAAHLTEQTCPACFDKSMPNTGEGLTLVHHHLINGITCLDCHESREDPHEPPTEKCLSCHGTPDEVAAKTAKMDPDPHNSPHYGTEQECSLCHHQHEPSENFCSSCHEWKLDVP